VSDGALLDVESLSTDVASGDRWLRVVDDVSLRVEAGRAVGIVGESGSGKTMLVRSVMQLLPPRARVRHEGRVLLGELDMLAASPRQRRAAWGSQVAIVLQDPLRSLNPVMRVEPQLGEAVTHARPPRRRASRRRLAALLAEVGIPEPERRLRSYPHELSGGMRQRVTIAMALAAGPGLLIADEPTTALDVTVQAQIIELLRREQADRNMALMLISHDLALVAANTDELIVMYAGQVVERGPSRAIAAEPRMPYTRALLDATPRLTRERSRPAPIAGRPPAAGALPSGCRFHPRCPIAQDRCRTEAPPLHHDGQRSYRCWYPLTQR
jgi:oligopeptide/dipeptide ABC transporter ATP-binding protein